VFWFIYISKIYKNLDTILFLFRKENLGMITIEFDKVGRIEFKDKIFVWTGDFIHVSMYRTVL